MIEFIILLFLGIFIILYRKNPGENVYKFFIDIIAHFFMLVRSFLSSPH